MEFKQLGLPNSLVNGLAKEKHVKPYPIQEKAIPPILNGKDVLGIAKTGSGKTGSYVLPILSNYTPNKVKNRLVDILVLVPTRELAVQVEKEFRLFASFLKDIPSVKSVFGGVSINPQMKGLFGVNILVATPGRLLELIKSKAIEINQVKTLVLDEADKMLNLGFKDEMNELFKLLPAKRQNLLFSATLSKEVQNINQLLLKNPEVIKIDAEEDNIDLIEQFAYHVRLENKGPLLRYIIKTNDFQQVLVFTSSVYQADNVANKLRKNGIKATAIHSKKSQGARTDALEKFKDGKLRVLVATDLLSRGIDIQFLPVVINFELPRSPKDYIHRIGRTGRAENPGKAISFVTLDDEHHFKIIQKKMGKQVEMLLSESIELTGH